MPFSNTKFPLRQCKGGFLKLVTLSLPKLKTFNGSPLSEIKLQSFKFSMVSYTCYISKCNFKPCIRPIKIILQEACECQGSFRPWDLTYTQDEKVFQGLVRVPQWLLKVSQDGALPGLQTGWIHEMQQSILTWQKQTCSGDQSSYDCK